ncbi:LA2681 family HEPN domain-containing protein [Flammeovirga sp. SJP92]|uniref:LA2681 family HEPN domain-containing protein n=1 Tax=Flammeovirga sp. SJP92 TaxID=1775430 RepID=UPI00078738E6|nr:LA2681 family HEPN domain-containing protein [Flammeovirga sp. SJP92]KXX67463.1 hypothetical protein AVL50_29465 [Flammeovirga sp. SJP92]
MLNSKEALEDLSSMIGVEKKIILKKISEYDEIFKNDKYYQEFIEAVMCNLGIDNRCQVLLSVAKYRLKKKNQTNQVVYILANCEYQIAILKNRSMELIDIKEYRDAVRSFLEVKSDNSTLINYALTNAGNILNKLGRNYEAILLHDKVIAKNPSFGIALGNKALELKKYQSLALHPQDHLKLLDLAKDLLLKALNDPRLEDIGGEGTKEKFIKEIEEIETELKKENYNQIKKTSTNIDLLSHYQKFSLEYNLYLNYDFGIFYDDDSLVDSLFPIFTEPLKEKDSPNGMMSKRVYFSFQIWNQIIEIYVSSRYSLFNALNNEYKIYDDNVNFVHTYDSFQHNHQFGLLKSTFCNVYNCLDKIARLVSYYFSEEEKIYDDDIYFDYLTKDEFKKVIENTENKQLQALYSLSLDFKDNGYLYNLQWIRNKITHSYLNVIDNNTTPTNKDQILLKDLIKCTFEIFQIVKSALLYFEIAVRKCLPNENTFQMFVQKQKDI